MADQDRIFAATEADGWFLRNRDALHHEAELIAADAPLRLMAERALRPTRVLEIGCSNGWRLGEISRRYGAACVGVEPSAEAIRDGQARYPAIRFLQGTAASIPLQEAFDLVVVHYVLHWVARETLLASLAEIDRVVTDGGYVLLGDFFPDQPMKNRYHHLPDQDVYTYKADYAHMFVSTGLYTIVSRVTFDHQLVMSKHDPTGYLAHPAQDNRGACTLLRKSLETTFLRQATP